MENRSGFKSQAPRQLFRLGTGTLESTQEPVPNRNFRPWPIQIGFLLSLVCAIENLSWASELKEELVSPMGVTRKLFWSDEFDGVLDSDGKRTFDRRKWNTTHNAGWGAKLRTYGDDGGFHRWVDKDYNPGGLPADQVLDPFSFPEPSLLRISLWKLDDGPVLSAYSAKNLSDEVRMTEKARFATGFLATDDKFYYRYGYIEARIRLPPYRGSWPAFWLMPLDPSVKTPPVWGVTEADHEAAKALAAEARPQKVEFDIMEYLGHIPQRFTTAIHSDPEIGIEFHTPEGGVGDAWHIYGFDWTPTDWAFIFDGKIIRRGKTTPQFDKDHYVILSMGAGGDWYKQEMMSLYGKKVEGWEVDESSMPWTMDIDYVRVWQ